MDLLKDMKQMKKLFKRKLDISKEPKDWKRGDVVLIKKKETNSTALDEFKITHNQGDKIQGLTIPHKNRVIFPLSVLEKRSCSYLGRHKSGLMQFLTFNLSENYWSSLKNEVIIKSIYIAPIVWLTYCIFI